MGSQAERIKSITGDDEMIKITVTEEQKTLIENDVSYREASALAIFLVKKHFSDNEDFFLCDSTSGVISQIDNMVCGLVMP